jgi:hypothetical protein
MNNTAVTEKPGQDKRLKNEMKDEAAGQPGQESGQDIRGRTKETGGPDRSAWTGQSGHDGQNMAARVGQLGQNP